jgi:hypothetical protein
MLKQQNKPLDRRHKLSQLGLSFDFQLPTVDFLTLLFAPRHRV